MNLLFLSSDCFFCQFMFSVRCVYSPSTWRLTAVLRLLSSLLIVRVAASEHDWSDRLWPTISAQQTWWEPERRAAGVAESRPLVLRQRPTFTSQLRANEMASPRHLCRPRSTLSRLFPLTSSQPANYRSARSSSIVSSLSPRPPSHPSAPRSPSSSRRPDVNSSLDGVTSWDEFQDKHCRAFTAQRCSFTFCPNGEQTRKQMIH